MLTSSVSHVCHKTHRNQYEVARVSRVTPCPLAMSPTIRLLLRSKPRGLVAAGEVTAGTKEGSSPNCWGPVGFLRPGVSQETEDRVSSQPALVWSGKEVPGAAGGKPRAPAGEQDATAPSEGAAGCRPLACLCTGLCASQGNCNFSNQHVFIKDHRIWLCFYQVFMTEQAPHLLYSRPLLALFLC